MLSFNNTQSWHHVRQKHKTEHIYTHPFIFTVKHRYKKNESKRESIKYIVNKELVGNTIQHLITVYCIVNI